jgi:F-type H+-transporting ATPase subunit epsilon
MSLKIRVITPDKIILNTSSEAIVLPSTSGQLGILTDHAPLITALEIGVLRFKSENDWSPIILLGGFAEIENNEVTILVNGVEEVSTIDIVSAKKDLDLASEELLKAETSKSKIEASQKLKKASARVQAAAFIKS